MVDAQFALQVHLGIGLVIMSVFSIIFARNYMQTPVSTNRPLKNCIFITNFITLFYYMITNILYNTTNPNLQSIDPITLRYLQWLFTTPLIITDIMILDYHIASDIVFICIIDVIMILSGYIAHMASDPIAIWTLFGFGMLNGGILGIQVLKYIDTLLCKFNRSLNERAFIFLAWYIIIIWSSFPILFILRKTNTLSIEFELCAYVYLDIFAKGIFGILILGIRDKLYQLNFNQRIVRFADAIISIVPIERTDTSVTPITTNATNHINTINDSVNRDNIVSPPQRTRTSSENASDTSDAYSEVISILSVRDERLLENTSNNTRTQTNSIVSMKPPAPMDTPPPRWQ